MARLIIERECPTCGFTGVVMSEHALQESGNPEVDCPEGGWSDEPTQVCATRITVDPSDLPSYVIEAAAKAAAESLHQHGSLNAEPQTARWQDCPRADAHEGAGRDAAAAAFDIPTEDALAKLRFALAGEHAPLSRIKRLPWYIRLPLPMRWRQRWIFRHLNGVGR